MGTVTDRNGTEVIATALRVRGSVNAAGTRPEDALGAWQGKYQI
jgi:hypothetical protein